jgi:DNA repair exonuclease SbcCD nuclease subunit
VAQAITTLSGVRLNLVSTPYPHKNSFDAVLPDEDLEDRIEAISRSLETGISALIEKVQIENPDLPTIFVGHLSVLGAAIGTEVTMRFGWDVAVRSGVFDPIEYAALGHIHRQQQIGEKAWYAGSPEYMDFGEMSQPKGFLLVEAEKGATPKVEVIDSKPRAMASIEATWTADDSWVLSGDIPKESILRVTATTTVFTPPSEIAALARLLRGKGASYFKIDYQKPDSPVVGKPAIDRSADAVEALKVWLVANKHEVEPALSLGAALLRSVSESHDLEGA